MDYFIVDLQSDYKAFADIKKIRELLTEVLFDDAYSCKDDVDIVIQNLRIMRELAEHENISISFLKGHLESYGYKIIDLMQLQRDLEDIKQFVGKENLFDEIIKLISEGE